MKDDFKLLDRLITTVEQEMKAPTSCQVGYFDDGDRHPRSGESAPYIAAINNNGGTVVENNTEVFIPSRPFIRDGLSEGEIPAAKEMRASWERFQAGKESIESALENIGVEVLYFVNNALDEAPGRYLPNAPYTEKMKGFNRPLYETGWLRTKTDTRIKKGNG